MSERTLKDQIVENYQANRAGCVSPFMTVNGIAFGSGFFIAYDGNPDDQVYNACRVLLHMARCRLESESYLEQFEAALREIIAEDTADLVADARILISCVREGATS